MTELAKPDPTHAKAASRGALLCWLGWFVWLNGLFATAVALRYVPYMGSFDSVLGKTYLPLALYGHGGSLALAVGLLVLPLIAFGPLRRSLWVLAGTLASVGVFLLFIDTLVYSLYRFHINGYTVALLVDGGGEIIALSWATWAVAAVALVVVVLIEVLLVRVAWRITRRAGYRFAGLFAGSALVLSGVASHAIHIWADALYLREITTATRHLPLYRPSTAKSFAERMGVDIAKNRAKRPPRLKNSSGLRYPLSPLVFTQPDSLPNVLLILIDTWRADALGAETTPNISRFVEREGTLEFSNHFSAGNGTWAGIFGLFYGLPFNYWPAFYGEQVGPVLTQRLLDTGFEFGIFASSTLTRPEFDRTAFSVVEGLRTHSQGSSAWERDLDALADWKEFQRTRDGQRPFFGFLFFDAVHSYEFAPDYPQHFSPIWERVDHLELNEDFDVVPYRNRYNQSVHFVDSLIGEVLDDLTARGVIDSTIVIITSDHGESFNDKGLGYWGHGSNFTREQAQVPFVVHWPGKESHEYTHTSSHLDIVPTLMRDVLGCQSPYADYGIGRHLTDTEPREALVVSGLRTYGVLEPDRITVLYEVGDYEIFDRNYQATTDAGLTRHVSRIVLQEMVRFYE